MLENVIFLKKKKEHRNEWSYDWRTKEREEIQFVLYKVI